MRVIKFRGKRKDNGEWVVGSLSIEFDNTHRISLWVNTLIEPENNYWESVNEIYEVIPETVGQFTGLKDKNGVEIYEHDFVQSANYESELYISVAMWDTQDARFIGNTHINGRYLLNACYRSADLFYLFEIVGNIHDNPELLIPPADSPALHTMNIYDPKEGQEEVKAPATETEQVPAPTAGEAKESAEGE